MTTEQAYRVLEVEPGSDALEVQRAYRRKALELHPDRAGSSEQSEYFYRRFLEVRDAYEHLRAQGFPMEEPEQAAPEVSPASWTAGRSFAPKKGEAQEVGLAQKLGLDFQVDLGAVFLWLVLIPGGVAVLVYFVKFLLGVSRGVDAGQG